MSDITKKKFEEKKEVIPLAEYMRRHPEEAKAIIRRARKEEERIKRELFKEQIKGARNTLRCIKETKEKLKEVIEGLTGILLYIFVKPDKEAILRIRSDIEQHVLRLEKLEFDWKLGLKRYEEEYK